MPERNSGLDGSPELMGDCAHCPYYPDNVCDDAEFSEADWRDAADDDFDCRVFGAGEHCIDAESQAEYASVKATGVSGRAKQFVPFAALKGFTQMVENAARSHDDKI